MARTRVSVDVQELARAGAEARLRDLHAEIAALVKAFPGVGRLPNAATATTTRQRSRMSAAARKAVSVRMKKYWAGRRKARGKRQPAS
jgi:hypothetical protein